MIDFNDEKITEYEKQDLLNQQIDPVYKKKRKKYGYIPFKAGWIITYEMLEILNNDATENEGVFSFYQDDLKEFDPSMTCVLFEGDRINEGEWDKHYECWSKTDYIRCLVVFPTGIVTKISQNGWEQMDIELDPDNEEVFKNKICKYPNSWNIDGTWNTDRKGTGVIEFNTERLNELKKEIERAEKEILESRPETMDSEWREFPAIVGRSEKNYWKAKANFDNTVSVIIKEDFHNKKRKENRRTKIKKRSKSKLKKTFKKGFSL